MAFTKLPTRARERGSLGSLIQRAEADDTFKVLVFKSGDSDYFISHVDLTRISEYRAGAAKLTGGASIALLFRYLSASPIVSIAQIEGRVRAAGSEFVLACDMRFAARESAIFCQFEPSFGVVPGGGGAQHLTRLMGRARALEVMLSAEDYDADLAGARSPEFQRRTEAAMRQASRPETGKWRWLGCWATCMTVDREPGLRPGWSRARPAGRSMRLGT